MRKIIEEIVTKYKNSKITYNEMIIEIDSYFIFRKIDREIQVNNIDDNMFMLSIKWRENGQELTYQNVFQ